jgi:hypothetical protein
METQNRRLMKPKRRKEPTAARGRGSSAADLQEQLDRQTRELAEAREQQVAASEILRVISSSPTDVQPVFDTIVRNAVSLCGSLFANVFRFDGELLHFVASHNVGPSYVIARRIFVLSPVDRLLTRDELARPSIRQASWLRRPMPARLNFSQIPQDFK